MSYDDGAAILMLAGGDKQYPATVNPLKPQGFWLHDRNVVHVMRQGYRGPKDTPRLELWSGSGQTAYYTEGEKVLAHHDQSGVTKGTWTCIGAVRWTGTDEPAEVLFGEVPSRKIRVGVFK